MRAVAFFLSGLLCLTGCSVSKAAQAVQPQSQPQPPASSEALLIKSAFSHVLPVMQSIFSETFLPQEQPTSSALVAGQFLRTGLGQSSTAPHIVAGKATADEPSAGTLTAEKTVTGSTASATPAVTSNTTDKIADTRKNAENAKTPFLGEMEAEILQLQNDERARLELPPLVYDAQLQAAARLRSEELYKNRIFKHQRPDGSRWDTVLREDIPYTFSKAGENLCTSQVSQEDSDYLYDPSFWVELWLNSPGHYANMVKPDYNRAGVGVYCVTKNGVTHAYATTLFAEVED